MCDRFWEDGNVAFRETRGNGEIHRGNSAYSFEGLRWCKDSIRAIALLLSVAILAQVRENINPNEHESAYTNLPNEPIPIFLEVLAY